MEQIKGLNLVSLNERSMAIPIEAASDVIVVGVLLLFSNGDAYVEILELEDI